MKIIIRPWAKKDVPALAVLANNFNIWKNVRDALPHPYSVKDAEEWINICVAREPPLTNFAIEADGKPAGAIGCTLQKDIYRKNIEIGYFIGEAFWGKGIATAAVKQLVDMLVTNFDVVRLYAGVFENNPGSMRVLEKNGFHLESIHQKSIFKNNELLDEHIWVKMV